MAVALDLGSYSDIGDYSALVEKIKLWLDRGSELDQHIPTFIRLAEAYLSRVLRTPEMEAVSAPVLVAGTFRMPLGCVQIRGLSASGAPLTAVSPSDLAASFGPSRGHPQAFAIYGRDVRVAPVSDAPLALSYWQAIPSLTLDNPVNWLLDSHPDVYLYGALAQAQAYIDNPEQLAQWTGAFEGVIEQIKTASERARWGGPLVARPKVAAIGGVRA